MAKSGFGSLLAVPAFRYLWFNQFLSQLAYNTLNFALIIWVYKLTGSNSAVAIVVLCIYLPSLLLGVFGGLLADIVDKKKVLLVTDLLYALSYLAFIPIRKVYPLIVLNTFFLNSLNQFFIPAESSAMPLVVGKEKLFLANSMFSLTLYVSLLLGFASAGPVLTHFGMNTIFIIGFISQTVGLLMISQLSPLKSKNLSPHSKQFLANYQKQGSILKGVVIKDLMHLAKVETKETLSYIKGKFSLTVAIGLLAVMQGVVGILAVLVPSYLERVLRIHATDASYFLMMPLGMGTILGALLIGKVGSRVPKRLLVIPAVIVAGLVFFTMGATPRIARTVQSVELPQVRIPRLRYFHKAPTVSTYFAVGAFLLGLCTVSVVVPAQTLVQEQTNEKIRGKIMSVLVILMNTFSAVPVLLAGVLSDLFGVATVFAILGVLVFILGLIAFKPARFFREAHLPYRIREFLGLGHWR